MLEQESIREAIDRLAAAASSPARIILFGSYGRGTADPGSDLDLEENGALGSCFSTGSPM